MLQSPRATDKLSISEPQCRATGRVSLFTAVVAFACAAGILLATCDATDQGPNSKSKNRNAAAAAKAHREKMISSLQQQVAKAQQILEKAASKSQMTQAELNSATSRLSGIREEIEDTQHDAVEAAKTLHEVEAELLAHQGPGSEYVNPGDCGSIEERRASDDSQGTGSSSA